MEQHSLTLAAEIEPRRLEALRSTLEQLRAALADRARTTPPLVDFAALGTVHFARLVVIEEPEGGRPPCLVFATDFDGGRSAHLARLAEVQGDGLQQIFAHCVGFRTGGGSGELVRWMAERSIEPLCTYRGHPGRSVEQIHQERALRDALHDHLRTLEPYPGLDVRRACDARVRSDPALAPLLAAPAPTRLPRREKLALHWRWARRCAWPLARTLWAAERRLSALETADEDAFLRARRQELERGERPLASRPKLLAHEDLTVSNQLTHVAELKPDPLRRELLEHVLQIADLRARTRFDRGELSGIGTIHFARWFLLPEPPASPRPPRLVFFSNYDGTWESYLGDFVDQAAWKLTAIWAHTADFPPTEALALRGARNERWFKEFVRRYQVPTQVWYAAYPDLTVSEINRNSELRRLLPGRRKRAEQEAWLRCL